MGRFAGWLAYKQTFVARSEAIDPIPHSPEGECHVLSHRCGRRQPASRFVEPRARTRRDLARPADFSFEFVEIGELPLYRDYDADFPEVAKRQAVDRGRRRAAVLHARVQPLDPGRAEECAGLPRPWGSNSWSGKPGAVLGTSPGATGTALAQQHLRNVLAYLDVKTLGQPEMFIKHDPARIDDRPDRQRGHPQVPAGLRRSLHGLGALAEVGLSAPPDHAAGTGAARSGSHAGVPRVSCIARFTDAQQDLVEQRDVERLRQHADVDGARAVEPSA